MTNIDKQTLVKAYQTNQYLLPQITNSFSYLEIAKIETSGEGVPIPIWRIKNNDFNMWEIGRVFIESDHDYKVR